MDDVVIGEGNLAGKGVYANKDFKKGDVVIQYQLKPLTKDECNSLAESEKQFIHTHWGQMYLYAEPERYVNHSATPNTYQDLQKQCDIASRDISKGEEITTNANLDDVEDRHITIRAPKRNECEQVVSVINSEKETWKEVLSDEEMAEIGIGEETVENLVEGEKDRNYLVAVADSDVVGFISWYLKNPNVAWVSMLQVVLEMQGKGVGSKLIDEVEKQASEKGCKAIALETQKKAGWAVKFYLRNGYRVLENEESSNEPFAGILSRPIEINQSYCILGKELNK